MGELSRKRGASLVLAAWLLSLGVDFFLHAGVLAYLYTRPSPFLLPPETAFARIPAGYLSFLLLTAGLFWLLERESVRGPRAGFRVGLGAGLFAWGAFLLGLWSIASADPSLLVAWWIGQSLELGLAGAVLGAGLDGTAPRRLWAVVAVVVLVLGAVTVLLQSTGLAPAVRLEG